MQLGEDTSLFSCANTVRSVLLLVFSLECRYAGNSPADDESVDVVGALVSIDSLQVHDMPDHVVFVRDPVPAEHVPALPGNVQGLAAVVPLQDGDHLRDHLSVVLESAQMQAGVQAKRDLREGVRHLLLDQLVGRQRPAELLPV